VGAQPGGGTFANKNFANSESTVDFPQLAKVRWALPVTLINVADKKLFSPHLIDSEIGESTVDFRHWQKSYWRKSEIPSEKD